MFHSTTHYKNWIFDKETELYQLRHDSNQQFIMEKCSKLKIDRDEATNYFLSLEEEATLINHYLIFLKDFCRKFSPSMPKYVTSTAIHYFKRFYLKNSVMEHHPKHIMVTCVYLAAKIEEFNVSMDQFLSNVKGDRDKASRIVLNNELLLLDKINYQLTIWHPFRPIEGFMIDIKTRFPRLNPEVYRKEIDAFIDQCYSTDIIFLIKPNQLALLAIINAVEKTGDSIDEYLQTLFKERLQELDYIRFWIPEVNQMISRVEMPSKSLIKKIEIKLEYIQAQIAAHEQKTTDNTGDNEMDYDDDYSNIAAHSKPPPPPPSQQKKSERRSLRKR